MLRVLYHINKNLIMTFKELLDTAKIGLEDLTSVSSPDFRLEQAEFNSEKKEWEVIISFLVENTNKKTSPIAVLSSDFIYYRIYKKLRINENKEIVGFYIFDNKG